MMMYQALQPITFRSVNRVSVKTLWILMAFLPVLSIAFHSTGLIALPTATRYLVLPAWTLLVSMAIYTPAIGRQFMHGWLWGIVAVACYDLSRIPFILAGWQDFVPHIGQWLTGQEHTPAWVGYLWRYAGNGGGMGIVFVLILQGTENRKTLIRKGLIYGLFIFSTLVAILYFFPQGQNLMFKLTSLNICGSLLGHIVYGLVLGLLAAGKKKK